MVYSTALQCIFEAEQMAEEAILKNMRSLYDITEKLLKDKYMTAAVSAAAAPPRFVLSP